MSYADLRQRGSSWQRLFPLFDRWTLWLSYIFALIFAVAVGYSIGSSQPSYSELTPRQLTLIGMAAVALLVIFLLDRMLRHSRRRRAELAEQSRLSKEAVATQLLDPVERSVLAALDEIADAKGVDRATLIPAILHQYVARKTFEAALLEHAAQTNTAPEDPPGWSKTLPAWLETLPGSLDVKER